MKLLPFIVLAMLSLHCSCATIRQQVLDREAELRRDMQDETVKIEITLAVKQMSTINQLRQALGLPTDPESPDEETVVRMACSGVVVDKAGGIVRKPKTLLATAHHCFDVRPGSILDDDSVVQAVVIIAQDNAGRTCGVDVLKLGGYGPNDVATGRADCDLGKVARLADAVPQRQEQIFISGHPMGVYPGLVTTGYVSGWMNGWILLSAPAWGGNSGGPVFNSEGEVIGLLVRGSREYHQLTLAAPLGEIQDRINQTQDW